MILWNDVTKFSPSEFSEDPDKYADPALIVALQDQRLALGAIIHPSPAPGALARFSGSDTSRHYVGPKDRPVRKSDAIDLFTDAPAPNAFLSFLGSGLWGAIGVYFDTKYNYKPHVMFHLDRRPRAGADIPLIWYRVDGQYHYVMYEGDQSMRNLLSMLAKDA